MNRNVNIDERKRSKSKAFVVPTMISESVKISAANEDKISLIETERSPALQSDLDYILNTGRRGLVSRFLSYLRQLFSFKREVTTEYFLTYHQRDDNKTEGGHKNGYKRKQKKQYKYVGDEILRLIRFNKTFSDKSFLLFITDFEVGGGTV